MSGDSTRLRTNTAGVTHPAAGERVVEYLESNDTAPDEPFIASTVKM